MFFLFKLVNLIYQINQLVNLSNLENFLITNSIAWDHLRLENIPNWEFPEFENIHSISNFANLEFGLSNWTTLGNFPNMLILINSKKKDQEGNDYFRPRRINVQQLTFN